MKRALVLEKKQTSYEACTCQAFETLHPTTSTPPAPGLTVTNGFLASLSGKCSFPVN